ncbi:hypothetical protein V6N12_043525 [Hibiscus sabdariffa]|uniref:Uncharacterized protein n=1 Tax=Hibiscus sabdariffa TaxID=183260 RepID=A0ABR2DEK9_9ROSI
MLQDWRAFVSLPSDLKNQSIISWRVPRNCSLDSVISNIGLKIRFLDTAYFGGLCEPSRDLNVLCKLLYWYGQKAH